ncbi:MAG: peptidoglycan-associated lipoprotein Pal [Gallionellaceae bacterium]|nr:peptidoglycan-associated lipoprotein Pal [Gallionellaceae bacterium]
MKRLLLSSVLIGFLAACASEPAKEEMREPAASTAAEPTTTGSADMAATSTQADASAMADSAAAMPENNSVYFPFDVDAVQAADRATIQAHGAYLSKNSGAKVRVEGNADERGSSEYNLGLGQRRANNVRKALILAGAKDSQIETVSFGEEKPICTEHNEACWAQNRRADIVYK